MDLSSVLALIGGVSAALSAAGALRTVQVTKLATRPYVVISGREGSIKVHNIGPGLAVDVVCRIGPMSFAYEALVPGGDFNEVARAAPGASFDRSMDLAQYSGLSGDRWEWRRNSTRVRRVRTGRWDFWRADDLIDLVM